MRKRTKTKCCGENAWKSKYNKHLGNEYLKLFENLNASFASACIIVLRGDSWPMMLAAATPYWSQSTGVHRQPTAHYCRLSCPNCGRSYKYRSGLRGHIADCLSEKEKLEADFRQRQEQRRQQQQQEQRRQQQFTEKDVRALYKFWKS